MPKIYVQSDNDEQPIEFTGNIAELVPDEVFFGDNRYRTVVDESVQRRQKIKELNSKLHEAQTPEPTPTPEPVPATPTPAPVIDEETLYKNFKERQARELAEANQANAALVALLEPNGLDASFLPILENAKDPVKAAEELGRKKLSFASGGANPANTPDANNIFARINKDLGLK
jgi:hypothetical protein